MWDPVANRMVGEPVIQPEKAAVDAGGLWEALDRFTFGTPDLVLCGRRQPADDLLRYSEGHHPRPGLPLPGEMD